MPQEPDDIRCLITMRLDVHDELPKKEKFSLGKLFGKRNGEPRESQAYHNSHGVAQTFEFDYSTIPAILAAAEKFADDSREFFAERDRKPWIRHGSQLHFDVSIGFASDLGKQHFAQSAFDVETLTADRLEAELAPFNTKETAERRQAGAEKAAQAAEAIGKSLVLHADTLVNRPLTFKPR
jgi:hypothetical protein